MRYPTLTANAEGILCDFFRRCESPEELKMREEAALVAVTRLYERRMAEIRTTEEMQRKAAAAARTDRDGENKEEGVTFDGQRQVAQNTEKTQEMA